MAIGATLLTSSYDNVDRTSYTTASISPAANSLLLLFVTDSIGTGNAPEAVPTGLSLTWERLGTREFGPAPAVRRSGAWVAQCGGSPGSGTVTLTENDRGSGTTSTGTSWVVIEITGHHTTQPVRQVQYPGTGTFQNQSGYQLTGLTLPMVAAADSNSRGFSYFVHQANEATTFRTNWSELSDNAGASPVHADESQWRSDAFETTASATWATASRHFGFAIEIAEAAAPDIARATIATYADTASETSPVTVNMPTDIDAGDLLIAYISADANATVAAGGGEGWTSIQDTSNGTAVRLKIFAKIAAGGDALTLTVGGSDDTATHVHRITNHGVSNVATDIELGTAATGTSAAPDPPSKTPSASETWLVIACNASDDDDNVVGLAFVPTGYVPLAQTESAATANSTMVQVACDVQTTGSAINPGAFTLAASEEWVAQTLLIPPLVADVDITATTVTIPVEVPTATLTASATVTAATVTIPVEVPTATVTAAVGITPTPVTITAEVPAASVTATASVTAATVTIPVEVPTPTVTASTSVTAGTVTILVEVPAATVATLNPINPDTVTIPVEVPTPTVMATATVTAAPITIPVEVPTPTVTTGTNINPNPVTIPVEVPAATVTTTAAVTAQTVTVPVEVPTAAVTATTTIAPDPVTVLVEVPSATVTTTASITASTVTIPVEIPAATVDVSTSDTINAQTVTIPVEVPTATVTASANITATTVTIPVEVPTATVTTGTTVTAATVTIPVDVPTPTLTASATITPNPVVIPIEVPAVTVTTATTINPVAVTIPVEIPTIAVTASATVNPNPVTIPVEVPTATVDTSVNATITPNPVTVLVELPIATIIAIDAVVAGLILTLTPTDSSVTGCTTTGIVTGQGSTSVIVGATANTILQLPTTTATILGAPT
jgi:hypothetical protein